MRKKNTWLYFLQLTKRKEEIERQARAVLQLLVVPRNNRPPSSSFRVKWNFKSRTICFEWDKKDRADQTPESKNSLSAFKKRNLSKINFFSVLVTCQQDCVNFLEPTSCE